MSPYPRQVFTALIWGTDRDKFESPPEEFYKGKNICVEGLIEAYRGKAQIEESEPSHIIFRGVKKMRRLLLITCILLIWTSAQAQDKPILDGYVWEKAEEAEKILVIGGYIWGYNSGYMAGIMASESILKKSDIESAPVKGLRDRASEQRPLHKSLDFYINELDSFLKAYPLCRRQHINATLSLLAVAVWNSETRIEDAYEVVGKYCSELRD